MRIVKVESGKRDIIFFISFSLPDVPGYGDHLGVINRHQKWLEEEEVSEIMKNQRPKMSPPRLH